MQPHAPPSRIFEKSCVMVRWGAALNVQRKATSLDGFRDWGHMPIWHDLSTCLLALALTAIITGYPKLCSLLLTYLLLKLSFTVLLLRTVQSKMTSGYEKCQESNNG